MPSTMAADMVHGGRLIAAQQMFPDAPLPWIDLSTGISPFSYPIDDIPPDRFTRLPEPEQEHALRRIAAVAFGAPDPAHVGLAPGSQMLISLLPLLIPCARAVMLVPGYTEHACAWRRAGIPVDQAETVDALLARAAPDTVLVLCNPNNPDGRRTPAAMLAELAQRCAALGGWLVVDEAYADLEPAVARAAPMLARTERLLVLRSFGKSYGLAGVRLGFLLGPPGIVRGLEAMIGPWPVSGPALCIGTRALADHDWLARAARRAAETASRLASLLRQAGLAEAGGTALFRLVGSEDAARSWNRLAQHGILVRRFADDRRALRFGLPADAASWRRLEAGLRSMA